MYPKWVESAKRISPAYTKSKGSKCNTIVFMDAHGKNNVITRQLSDIMTNFMSVGYLIKVSVFIMLKTLAFSKVSCIDSTLNATLTLHNLYPMCSIQIHSIEPAFRNAAAWQGVTGWWIVFYYYIGNSVRRICKFLHDGDNHITCVWYACLIYPYGIKVSLIMNGYDNVIQSPNHPPLHEIP